MRIAYADPPYPGQSKRLYGDHPDYAGEVDHAELVERLMTYDAWALSTSASALHAVLPLCPAPIMDTKKNKGRYFNGTGTRILVWAKPQTVWRPVDIQWSWEPILVYGARKRTGKPTLRDVVTISPREANTFTGSKPYGFCTYLFDALGAEPTDEFHDLFPGSGAVTAAWKAWSSQLSLLGDAS